MTKRDKFANEKQQYAMWLGLPPDVRQPKMKQEFAEKIGVAPETLSRWDKDPVVQQVSQNATKILGAGDLFKITQELIRKCSPEVDKGGKIIKPGDTPSIKLYLEWQGELKQEKIEKPIGRIILDITTDRKRTGD